METRAKNRIYVIGAGFTGMAVAGEIRRKGMLGTVVAFLDDDPSKIGSSVNEVPVLGPINAVVNLLKQTPADEALIAMPSATQESIQQIYTLLKKAEFTRIRILPSISQILDGVHLIQTREIDPQDLLGRGPVTINLKKSLAYLRDKRVLITGAGGSIGGELARQLLSGGASRLYLFGHGENSIFEIDRDLRILQEEGVGERASIVPIVGELQDRDYVKFLLKRLKADVIFHCAAHKHVTLMETNPVEVIKNNVFGTRNLLEAARAAHTGKFVLISTDKTVEPSSIYGASKKLAEELVLSHKPNGTDCMVVRFGNVLGSRGSIVPLFKRQIQKGGPLTITHPETSRFFMTIPEAASLVLKAGGVGKGGQLYLLDMGEPMLIRSLAEHMIRFYGFEPERDIPVIYIGLKKGEKLTESLSAPDEQVVHTEFPKINKVVREKPLTGDLPGFLRELEPVCFFDPARPGEYRNRHRLRQIVKRVLPTISIPEDEPEF